MTTRTSSKQVTFRRPFLLAGFERVEPAGIYAIDTVEELIDALTFPVWRRTATTLQLTHAGVTEHVPVDPEELHEALMRDGAQPDVLAPSFVPAIDRRKRVRDALGLGRAHGQKRS